MFEHASPQAILDTVLAPGFSTVHQWEAQLLALILIKARVAFQSEIPAGRGPGGAPGADPRPRSLPGGGAAPARTRPWRSCPKAR